MTIEEILKAVEEMDKDEFDKLISSKKLSDNVFDALREASDNLWIFKYEDMAYDFYAYSRMYFTVHNKDLADERKALIKKYMLVLAYYKTISKITDKFEKLIGSV